MLKCKAILLKPYFSMSVLLYICCIFSEHLFLRIPLDSCFCHWYMSVGSLTASVYFFRKEGKDFFSWKIKLFSLSFFTWQTLEISSAELYSL